MKKNCKCIFCFSAVLILFFSAFASPVLANINISLNDSDVTLSKEVLFAGDTTKIFARLNNLGDEDVLGYVIFSDNNKQIGAPQSISIRNGTYDDVFVDWKVTGGDHKIELTVFDTNSSNQNPRKDKVLQKTYSIDSDSDGDAIGDKLDPDDDNDGVPDEQEIKLGTNLLKTDTDGDGVNDKIDALPLDKTEWRDTNNNGVGDNKDTDADGDEISNADEIKTYGTNPLNADSDADSVTDGQEIKNGTDPNKKDVGTDPINFLNPNQWQAGFMNSIGSFLKNNDYLYYALGGFSLLVIYWLFRKKGRRRRK